MNEQHGLAARVEFVAGPGEHTHVEISCSGGTALVSLYGGQVLSYRPAGEDADILFLSELAQFQAGKAIRGGVPLCWPWFGSDPEGLKRPNHGFARTSEWRVIGTRADFPEQTSITLGLADDATSRDLWPHGFELQLEITLADTLSLKLLTRNTGADAFTISQALHTYFRVGDIDAVEVTGLEDTDYLDKTDDGAQKHQQGTVRFVAEVDRIYSEVSDRLVIRDTSLQRAIEITQTGGSTVVVWNPWVQISSEMADLDDEDYRRFVCVETANAGEDLVSLAPGGEHQLTACYRVEKLA